MERCCVSSAFCICGYAKRGSWQRLGVAACCSNCLRVSTIRGSAKRSPGSLRSRSRRLLLLVSWQGEVRPETATESRFYRRMLTRPCSLSGWQSIRPSNDVRAAFPHRKARVTCQFCQILVTPLSDPPFIAYSGAGWLRRPAACRPGGARRAAEQRTESARGAQVVSLD